MKTEVQPINLYSVTTAVQDPSMFFGRQDEVTEIIDKRLRHTHPVSTILIGGRKIGKTSLLYRIWGITRNVQSEGNTILIPVFVNLDEPSTVSLSKVFNLVASKLITTARQDWGMLLNVKEKKTGDPYEVFRRKLQSIHEQCSTQLGNTRFILMLDEASDFLDMRGQRTSLVISET